MSNKEIKTGLLRILSLIAQYKSDISEEASIITSAIDLIDTLEAEDERL